MRLSLGFEPGVEADQGSIPPEGSWEGCGEEGAPQASASSGYVPLAFVFSAIVVKRCEASERCRLFATDATKLRHADDKRERGAFADTGNAQHEIKAGGEIVVST